METGRVLTAIKEASAVQRPDELPAGPGLYTLWAAGPQTLVDLAIEDVDGQAPLLHRALYLGKAEESLATRVAGTHLASGKTGWSTLRRTLAGLLRLCPTARPSRIAQPTRKQLMTMTANFGLVEEDEERLTEWMLDKLEIRAVASTFAPLKALEREVGGRLKPPLDKERTPLWAPNPWREQVASGRKHLRDVARKNLGLIP